MYNHMKKRHEVDFDLKQFQNLYLEDTKFLRLFSEWKKSGYQKQTKPSLDRINNKKHYSLDNINMLTWAENRFKQSKIDGKRGRKPAVLQMLGKKIVRRFQSQRHAVRELGLSQGNLSSVLTGKRNTTAGYRFVYENPELLTRGEVTK